MVTVASQVIDNVVEDGVLGMKPSDFLCKRYSRNSGQFIMNVNALLRRWESSTVKQVSEFEAKKIFQRLTKLCGILTKKSEKIIQST